MTLAYDWSGVYVIGGTLVGALIVLVGLWLVGLWLGSR